MCHSSKLRWKTQILTVWFTIKAALYFVFWIFSWMMREYVMYFESNFLDPNRKTCITNWRVSLDLRIMGVVWYTYNNSMNSYSNSPFSWFFSSIHRRWFLLEYSTFMFVYRRSTEGNFSFMLRLLRIFCNLYLVKWDIVFQRIKCGRSCQLTTFLHVTFVKREVLLEKMRLWLEY